MLNFQYNNGFQTMERLRSIATNSSHVWVYIMGKIEPIPITQGHAFINNVGIGRCEIDFQAWRQKNCIGWFGIGIINNQSTRYPFCLIARQFSIGTTLK